MKMFWCSVLTISLLISGIASTPAFDSYDVDKSGNGKEIATEVRTLSTTSSDELDGRRVYLLIINIYTVLELSSEDGSVGFLDSILDDSLVTIPFATILLLVEEEDEDIPVPLDDVAKDFKDAGYDVEEINKDGETKFVKVDVTEDNNKLEPFDLKLEADDEIKVTRAIDKIRRKRSNYKCKRNKCKRYEVKDKKHDLYKKYSKGYVYGYTSDHSHGKIPIVKVAVQDDLELGHQGHEHANVHGHYEHRDGHEYVRQQKL